MNIYDFRLRPTDEDRFIFDVETSKYRNKNRYSNYLLDELWTGHTEGKTRAKSLPKYRRHGAAGRAILKRFKLEPSVLNPDKIRLEWEENGSDTYFSASALSDGTLRFICLATLLLQPNPPSIILIDEPELGLHPAAIQVLAGMLESAATHTQLIVATQSVTLINQLRPEHVWVVDREEGQSVFRHLKATDMSAWLEDYGLGELWEKNIFGGRP